MAIDQPGSEAGEGGGAGRGQQRRYPPSRAAAPLLRTPRMGPEAELSGEMAPRRRGGWGRRTCWNRCLTGGGGRDRGVGGKGGGNGSGAGTVVCISGLGELPGPPTAVPNRPTAIASRRPSQPQRQPRMAAGGRCVGASTHTYLEGPAGSPSRSRGSKKAAGMGREAGGMRSKSRSPAFLPWPRSLFPGTVNAFVLPFNRCRCLSDLGGNGHCQPPPPPRLCSLWRARAPIAGVMFRVVSMAGQPGAVPNAEERRHCPTDVAACLCRYKPVATNSARVLDRE